MEDLDIIRHDIQPGRMHPGLQPGLQHGLQPGRWPGCRARDRACIPAENRGRAACESRPGSFAIFRENRPQTFAIFRESLAGLRSPRPGCRV